jgi:MinD superfamily P-loop ATPase
LLRESANVHICNFEGVHMRTVAVTINKGGVGKKTLTKSLATAATAAGLNVLILDMDTQENAASWGQRRDKRHDTPFPLTRCTTERGLPEELQRAEKAGCDLVFIDTPPGRNSEAPAAVECSDLVLIPFWNDQDAYEGVARTALLVKRLGKPAVGVLKTPYINCGHNRCHVVVHPVYGREKDFRRGAAHGPAQSSPRSVEHSSDQSRENDADQFPCLHRYHSF